MAFRSTAVDAPSSPAGGQALRPSTSGGPNPGQALQAAGGRRPGPQESGWWRRWRVPLALVGSILALVAVVVAAWWFMNKPPFALRSLSDTITNVPSPTPELEEPSFTVVVVGYGGAGHEGSFLTDSILVVRILLEQKRLVMLSLPRDTWVTLRTKDGVEQPSKVNAAYVLGGPEELKRVLGEITGWTIDRYIGIDFAGFVRAFDELGGVTVTVERAFDDYEYPLAGRETMICEEMKAEDGSLLATPSPAANDGRTSVMDEIAAGTLVRETLPENVRTYPCRYEHLRFEAGEQVLTGEQALKFARSRHAAQDGSDFGRARRQQLLVRAAVDTLFRLNFLPKIPQVLTTLRSHLATDLSAGEIAEWLARAPEVRSYPITALALTTNNYLRNGTSTDRQFVLDTVPGNQDFSQVQSWLRYVTRPSARLQVPVVEISVSPRARATAEDWRRRIETDLQLPVVITLDASRNAPATGSAQLVPLTDRLDPAVTAALSTLLTAQVLDPATQSATMNGPHVRVVIAL